MNGSTPLGSVLREAIYNAHHVVIALGIACLSWLIFQAFGRDPDLIEAGWVFFCVTGILFHRESLSETYRDREAVENHPSSNAADLRNLGDHIRGEWLRILAKSLFLFSGFVSMYFLPRTDEFMDALRMISSSCLMSGVCVLDVDAVLAKLSRRELVRMVILEINGRPFGMSAEGRLAAAVTAGRDLYHDERNAWAVALGYLEIIREAGKIPDDLSVSEIIREVERHLASQDRKHETLRAYEPTAGGPSRKPVQPVIGGIPGGN